MVISINANPGQSLSLIIEVKKETGELADGYITTDGYSAPTVNYILLPNNSYAANYPTNMTEISTGIWKHSLILPSGISSVGSYICQISWYHPDSGILQSETYLIVVFMPFGNTSVSPG